MPLAISRYTIFCHGVFISFIRAAKSGFLNRYCFHCVYCHLRALIWFGGSLRLGSVRFRFGLVWFGLVTLGTVRMGFGSCWFSLLVTFCATCRPFYCTCSFVCSASTRLHRVRFIVNEMPIETPQSNSTKCA